MAFFHFVFMVMFSGSAQEADTIINMPKKPLVYQFNITENIMPATWRQTKQAFDEADSLNADFILIHMNTYGGTVLDADSIRTRIINCPIPVYAFIDNNAASGRGIDFNCLRQHLHAEGRIHRGCTVVNQTGQQMPDKYQSYMRSIMRSTAESHGGDTIIVGQDTTFQWFREPAHR